MDAVSSCLPTHQLLTTNVKLGYFDSKVRIPKKLNEFVTVNFDSDLARVGILGYTCPLFD